MTRGAKPKKPAYLLTYNSLYRLLQISDMVRNEGYIDYKAKTIRIFLESKTPVKRKGGEEMDKLEKWMTGKEKLTDIEIFKEALKRWQKIGYHFIDKGLAVWGDIMPLKSLEIIKGYEKRIAELEQVIKRLKESEE